MLVTTEMLWNELQEIKRSLKKLTNQEIQHSIEEVSLAKACKFLRRGSRTVLLLVKSGRLKAITYRDSKHKIRYRFRISDIHSYQDAALLGPENRDIVLVESPEDIAKRVFGIKIKN